MPIFDENWEGNEPRFFKQVVDKFGPEHLAEEAKLDLEELAEPR